MATVEKHISDLLHLHDCVIVPGLGGFVANHSAATVIEERHLFIPPTKQIGFNRSLSHDDGLLLNHISRREGMSYTQAKEQVGSYVSGILSLIEKEDTAPVEGIGNFRKDALGNILFTPDRDGHSFLTEAFGLNQFQFEPLVKTALSNSGEEPVHRLLQSRSPRYWAAAAAMLAGLFLFTSELKMPEQAGISEGRMFSVPANLKSSEAILNARAAQFHEEVTSASATMSAESSKDHTNPASSPSEAPAFTSQKGYHLIAGSYKFKEPASRAMYRYRENGFSGAGLLEAANGRFRISLSACSGKQDALDRLYEVREMPGLSEAWLLRK